jgi:ribosomal protein L30
MATMNTLNVTLVRSVIGRIEAHKATVRGLGLRRMHHTVTVIDTPATRGMINAVSYLLKVSEGSPVAKAEKAAKPVAKPVAAKAVAAKPAAKPVAAAKPAAKAQALASAATPKKFLTKTGADDLTAIEGVGPKISELLHAAGITSFAQLAAAKVSAIQDILKAAGSRYGMANPGTWPEQAALLAAGDYAGFEKLSEELDGGVRK